MIDFFDNTARMNPDQVFFSFVDEDGAESSYTYRQTRLAAAAIARYLTSAGVSRGANIVVDIPNCPAFVFLVLAAAYGSFTLIVLNQRLSAAQKNASIRELEQAGIYPHLTIDNDWVEALFGDLTTGFIDDSDVVERIYANRLGMQYGHAIMGEKQDPLDETIHFAERQAHLFDPETRAVIMFTSGTTGRPKAVPLSWHKLTAAAEVSNSTLPRSASCHWQAVLPLYHIGGLQILVRCVVGNACFHLYARFDAARVLADAKAYQCTHISVVDKMLRDLLELELTDDSVFGRTQTENDSPEQRHSQQTGSAQDQSPQNRSAQSQSAQGQLADYRCILLGGGATNTTTIEAVVRANAPVYMSYGMTETSSQIANSPVTKDFNDGLKLMKGYRIRIVDADANGYGRLAVTGPGVFDGYLNAQGAFTVDGYFLTGDTAAFHDGLLFVKERTSDMFVSGGENIYPAEIANALRQLPGVQDAYVFGIENETWGRRPAAVIEKKKDCPAMRPDDVRSAAQSVLSKLTMPDEIFIVEELPRTDIGKTDHLQAESVFAERLKIEKIVLHHIRLPFRTPFKTARATLTHRDLVLVEIVDHEGRVGLGECDAFDTDWYLPETLEDDLNYIREQLAPAVIGQNFAHPREISHVFATLPQADSHPLAQSALETAFWDLYGHIKKCPVWALINEEYERICTTDDLGTALDRAALTRAASIRGSQALVATGAVIGIGTPEKTLESVDRAVHSGYRRVKLKVSPRSGTAVIQTIREKYPDLIITLDANRSFNARDVDRLREIDKLHVTWIEEPIDTTTPSFSGSNDGLARLARLQRSFSTPLCVDESFTNGREAARILKFPELRCIAIKIGKFGGIEPALNFIAHAQASGREVWMGGMYDTGISRRVHAAFETLPGIIVPGDIGSIKYYFDTDVTEPAYLASKGYILLNDRDHSTGIGCQLNEDALNSVLVKREVIQP